MITPKPYTWVELNSAAFEHNVHWYKNRIGVNTLLAAVIKSNGYGHGLIEMGLLCEQSKVVDWICTATLSEAIALRANSVTKPIVVLSIIDEDPTLAAKHAIAVPVFDMHTAYQLNESGKKIHSKIMVHVKIDTGMSRYGFMCEEAVEAIREIQKLPYITIQGIFTSCAQAGSVDQSFTMHQLTQFDDLCALLEKNNIHIPIRHATNSAATSNFVTQFPRFNLARIGAGIYGLGHMAQSLELTQPNIIPIMQWKTRVSHIKHIQAGDYVGYDRTFQATRNTTLAVVPIGYQDGYDRRMSNKGIVFINNEYYAPVVGRICMNATIIAIPEGKAVSIGDEVMLLGDKPNLRAHEIATMIESFNAREITTRLSPSIERKITQQQDSIVSGISHLLPENYNSDTLKKHTF